MKKYLSLMIVFAAALTMGANVATAEDAPLYNTSGGIGAGVNVSSDSTSVNATTKVNLDSKSGSNLTPEQNRARLDTMLQAQSDLKVRIEGMRAEAKLKMEGLRAKVKDEKDAARAKIKEARVTGRENAVARLDAAVDRISALKLRVDAQISKLEAKGVDVANAKSFSATADAKLSAAETKIVEINAVLSISINELSADNKARLLALVQDTQSLIVDAHVAINSAIKSLKDELRIKMEAEASAKVGDNESPRPTDR